MGGIRDATIQAVRDAADIVDLASEMTKLQRAGRRYKGLCPFHKEKTPSFSVDPEEGLFYCFGCGSGGDAIKIWQQHTGEDFLEAIESLARRYGIPIERDDAGPAPTPGLTDALDAAALFFGERLRATPEVGKYLVDRGIPQDLTERYGLGYAPDDWRALLHALRQRVGEEALLAAGLVGRSERTGDLYDRFRHRLMFPIHLPSGRLVGFGGRTLGDDRAKYVNTSETEAFKKGVLLYGLAQAKRSIREKGRAFLVEGYFDVLGSVAAGFEESVAGMGTALTTTQAKTLTRYTDEVVVGFDGDEAGEKAFVRSLPLLLAAGLAVRRARFPAGEDPDSLRLTEGPEALARRIEEAPDGLALEIERLAPAGALGDPRETARAASEIAALLRPVRDPLERWAWGQKAAQRLGIPPAMLLKRAGAGGPPPPPEDPRPRPVVRAPSDVRTTEEATIVYLLHRQGPLPAPEDLPAPEIFLDPACRAIFGAFRRLFLRSDGHWPTAAEIQHDLAGSPDAVEHVARLCLSEEPEGPTVDLETLFVRLERRWTKKRLAELAHHIRLAEQNGDRDRIDELLDEKKRLSRDLHPTMTGRYVP